MTKMNYQIVYLNGPTSSGKSELVKALQNALDEPFLHIGVDRVIGFMPDKFNDWEGGPAPIGFSWKAVKDEDGTVMQEIQNGPFAKKMMQTYKQIVLTLAKDNHSIIIDDVAFGKQEFDRWKELLSDYKVLYVGIHAPLKVIEERERTRGNRIIGAARAQYKKVHQGITYDLDIDTHKHTVKENIDTIIWKLKQND